MGATVSQFPACPGVAPRLPALCSLFLRAIACIRHGAQALHVDAGTAGVGDVEVGALVAMRFDRDQVGISVCATAGMADRASPHARLGGRVSKSAGGAGNAADMPVQHGATLGGAVAVAVAVGQAYGSVGWGGRWSTATPIAATLDLSVTYSVQRA